MANINRVVLVGNLTRDPELRHTPSGTSVCKLRIAVNTRQKSSETGEWGDLNDDPGRTGLRGSSPTVEGSS